MQNPQFWKKYFRVYDVLNLLIPYQELLNSLVNDLHIKPGDKVLEAGCGTGNLALKIKQKGAEVVGIDYSKEALDIYKSKDKSVDVKQHDLTEKLPFPDESFDKIASNNVLYAIPQKYHSGIMKEFHRVLKPGGHIAMSNLRKGWSPYNIYKNGVKASAEKDGLLAAILLVTKVLIPTIKIFYYNASLQTAEKNHFFKKGEQKQLLKEAGFKKVNDEKEVYAKQALLVSGIK